MVALMVPLSVVVEVLGGGSILSGFVPEVAAISLCGHVAFQKKKKKKKKKVLSSFVLIVSQRLER